MIKEIWKGIGMAEFDEQNPEIKNRNKGPLQKFYPLWLIGVTVFLFVVTAITWIFEDPPPPFSWLKKQWNNKVLLIFSILAVFIGYIWLVAHLQVPFFLPDILGPEIFPAWTFPDGSIYNRQDNFTGVSLIDHWFMWCGMPFGVIFFWGTNVLDQTNKWKYNKEIILIFWGLLFFVVSFCAFFVDYSSAISYAIFVVPFTPLWFWAIYKDAINATGFLVFFLIMSVYVFIWDTPSVMLDSWIYCKIDPETGERIHSKLFAKYEWWWLFGRQPISIVFLYGWAGMYFMTPLMAFITMMFPNKSKTHRLSNWVKKMYNSIIDSLPEQLLKELSWGFHPKKVSKQNGED
jgi:hypothetical protein